MGIILLRRPNLVTSFDPATLSLTGWWRASYTGSPWVPSTSAGTSGSNGNMATVVTGASVGTAVNAYTPADFNGSSTYLRDGTSAASFLGTSSTIVCLFRARTATAPSATKYQDTQLLSTGNADFSLGFNTSGVVGFSFAGSSQNLAVAASTGAYHLAMARIGGGVMGVTLDSNAEVTMGCGTPGAPGGYMQMGLGYGVARYFDGTILEMMVANSDISASYANIKSYANARYALSL